MSRLESGEQRIMLADFGIARFENESSGLTQTNMTVGTVSYAAPEQLMGRDLDGRADQYALAATAYHLLTGSPPFQHSNPAVVISQHLSALPPSLADRRPELADLDPAIRKALSKEPGERFERCIDFAHSLGHHITTPLSGDFMTDPDATRLTPITDTAPIGGEPPPAPKKGLLQPIVLLPVVGVLLLLVIAFAFIAGRFRGEDVESQDLHSATTKSSIVASTTTTTTTTTTAATTTASTDPTVTDTVTDTQAPPAAVVGANCTPAGATGVTADGATVYCSQLQYTDRYLWSGTQGVIPNPVVTSSPTTAPPSEDESPVQICMQETGHTRARCTREILRGNAGF
jgi:serine/threonine-protein kinase